MEAEAMIDTQQTRTDQRDRRRAAAGLTLLEAMMASAVLSIVVLAVGAAVSAAQQASLEGQKMILGSMAADDLLSELLTEDYASLPLWDGVVQYVGEMETFDGDPYPDTFWLVGRSVAVTDEQVEDPELEVTIQGRRIVVSAFDENRVLAVSEMFVAEPAS